MLSNSKFGSDRYLLTRLVKSTIIPVIDYGNIVYETANKSILTTLQAGLNTGIRLAKGAFKTSPVNSLHADTGISPLHHKAEFCRISYALKVMASQRRPLHNTLTTTNQTNKHIIISLKYKPITQKLAEAMQKYHIEQEKFEQ